MGNKGSNRRPQRSYSQAARPVSQQRTSTIDSDKIGISNIPAFNHLPMKNSNGKDLDKILKEIKNNPEYKNIERLPRDTAKSEEFKKTLDLLNKSQKENEHDNGNGNKVQFRSVNEQRSSKDSNKNNSVNKTKSALRSKSSVEDLGKKRKKLMEHLHKLNQLENEKQIKLLEQKRDLYVENIKQQDSLFIQESIDNYFKKNRDISMSSFDFNKIKREIDLASDYLPYIKVNNNQIADHSLVPVFVETRIIPPESLNNCKRTSDPLYSNVANTNGDINKRLNSTKSFNDFNKIKNQENLGRSEKDMNKNTSKKEGGSNDASKLTEKELNLILMAIEKFEKLEEEKRSQNSVNTFRQSRYFYKDKQIYPVLDINAITDSSCISQTYMNKVNSQHQPQQQKQQSQNQSQSPSKSQLFTLPQLQHLPKQQQQHQQHQQQHQQKQQTPPPLKQLELKKQNSNEKLANYDMKCSNQTNNIYKQYNSVQSNQFKSVDTYLNERTSLSQVLKDIIIEFTNMSEEEFNRFKTDFKKSTAEITKQVQLQQQAIEQQKIPKSILEVYKNPYYEHCSYANPDLNYIKRSQSELISKKPSSNNSVQFADNLVEDSKRAQSFKALNGNNGSNHSNMYIQQERSNLKKLASKKDGARIFSNEEDLYDPIRLFAR